MVYPRVEEADPDGRQSRHEGIRELAADAGAVPRRLAARTAADRTKTEAVMAAFRANKVQALLATSLIEVGVDVPNATVMLIENAEQFGLAQLHQLRGRIGRGAHESLLHSGGRTRKPESRERLKVLEETNDGFRIAEADLKLRGPGELLGQQQSGAAAFPIW